MNKKQLYQEIGEIDEDLVEEALLDSERNEIAGVVNIDPKEAARRMKNLAYWSKWMGLVACMLVLIVVVREVGMFRLGGDSSGSVESVMDSATTTEGAQGDQADSAESEEELTLDDAMEDVQKSDTLVFVEVTQNAQVESSLEHPVVIHELSEQELESLIPSLSERYTMNGNIYLYALGNDDYMMKEGQAVVTEGDLDAEATITIAYDALPELYTYPEDAQKAEIEGVEVAAGYVIQSAESGGERIYVADFTYDYVAYHVEMTTLDYDIAEEIMNQLVQELLEGEVADLSSVVAGYVQTGE